MGMHSRLIIAKLPQLARCCPIEWGCGSNLTRSSHGLSMEHAGMGSGSTMAVVKVNGRGTRNTALMCLTAGNRPAF